MQQRRADKPRSRDGCITCKIRHVRCDQARPACGQCTRTGRKCDGYDSDLSQRQLRDKILAGNVQRRPSPKPRACAVFCIHTSQALAGSDFWTRLLPQLSRAPGAPCGRSDIGGPERRTSSTPNGARQSYLTLLGCSLFVCLEMLRANYDQALDHVDSGLKLISQQSDRLDVPQPTADVDTINRELCDLFARFHMDLASFNRGMRPHVTSIGAGHAMPFAFTDLGEARRRLTLLMNQSICAAPALNTRPGAGAKPSTWDPGFRAMVEELQAKLAAQVREFQAWSGALDRSAHRCHFAREFTSVGSTLIQFRADEREPTGSTPFFDGRKASTVGGSSPRARRSHRLFSWMRASFAPLQWVATHCHQPVVRDIACDCCRSVRGGRALEFAARVRIGETVVGIEEA
ncbi:hypothetical protein P168DRAFT_293953, partial [Aspergillus campestris IBT 28561]